MSVSRLDVPIIARKKHHLVAWSADSCVEYFQVLIVKRSLCLPALLCRKKGGSSAVRRSGDRRTPSGGVAYADRSDVSAMDDLVLWRDCDLPVSGARPCDVAVAAADGTARASSGSAGVPDVVSAEDDAGAMTDGVVLCIAVGD